MDYFGIIDIDDSNTSLKLEENYVLGIRPNIVTIRDQHNLCIYDNNYFDTSSVLSCYINGEFILYHNCRYTSILEQIYYIINDEVKIIQTPSLIPIKIGMHNTNEYMYVKNLDISYQKNNVRDIIREILHQSKHHNIRINIMIRLYNNDKIFNLII